VGLVGVEAHATSAAESTTSSSASATTAAKQDQPWASSSRSAGSARTSRTSRAAHSCTTHLQHLSGLKLAIASALAQVLDALLHFRIVAAEHCIVRLSGSSGHGQ
jgi:hypothetical protein